MSNEKDLRYYQTKSSKLEAQVINLKYRIRTLERLIASYQNQTVPALRSRIRELERIVANCCRRDLSNKKDMVDEELVKVKVIEGRGVTFTIKENTGGGGNGG